MAKVQLAVALSLLAVLAAPVGAGAQTLANNSSSTRVVFTEHEDHEDNEDEEDGEDFENNYEGESVTDDTVFGDGDGIDDGLVPLPPVVIEPRGAGFDGHGRPPASGQGIVGNEAGVPAPVRVDQLHVTPKTPADAFAEASYIALGALGLGAVSLGAVAGVRSYRLRKAGKTDYFYES